MLVSGGHHWGLPDGQKNIPAAWNWARAMDLSIISRHGVCLFVWRNIDYEAIGSLSGGTHADSGLTCADRQPPPPQFKAPPDKCTAVQKYGDHMGNTGVQGTERHRSLHKESV